MANAAPISMTQPYAAGGILSTVEDLFKRNRAVVANKLVTRETLQKAFSRYRLANGKESNYGYGFRSGFIQGSPSIWHDGLIDGFMSMSMYMPDEDVFVAILSNCDCVSPERPTALLAAQAIGKPYQFSEVTLPDAVLQRYTGSFTNDNGDEMTLVPENGKLFAQRGRGGKVGLKASGAGKFFVAELLMTMEFRGNVAMPDTLTVRTRNGNELWRRKAVAAPARGKVEVDEKTLDLFTGTYEMNPQFSFTVTREKDRLFVQASGQEKLELFAETRRKFFLKVNDARFEFVVESGKVSKALLWQGGRSADALRVR